MVTVFVIDCFFATEPECFPFYNKAEWFSSVILVAGHKLTSDANKCVCVGLGQRNKLKLFLHSDILLESYCRAIALTTHVIHKLKFGAFWIFALCVYV